jgi:hypothetical protein
MRQATAGLVGVAVAEALVPALDQTRTTGLVTLPGAFVGALFGEAGPWPLPRSSSWCWSACSLPSASPRWYSCGCWTTSPSCRRPPVRHRSGRLSSIPMSGRSHQASSD